MRFLYLKFALPFLLFFGFTVARAQQTVTIGSEVLNEKAVLTLVTATGDQGFLLPVVQDRSAISPETSEKGMLVYENASSKVYLWNGSTWLDITSEGSGGVVASLDDIADVNAAAPSAGQVLQFQPGTGWVAADVSLTDTDDQGLILTGDQLTIEGGTGSIDLSAYRQDISFNPATNELTISEGSTITIPSGGTDADADPTNEIQNLSLAGSTINISGGTGVDIGPLIPAGGTDDQTASEVSFNNTASGLTAGNVQAAIDELAAGGTVDTDDQVLTFDEVTHILGIEDGNTVDLSGLAGSGGSTLWKEEDDDIYFDAGNVGIGTAVPAVELGAGRYLTLSPGGATTSNQFPSLELQGHSGTGDRIIGRIDFISNSAPGNSSIARIVARRTSVAQFNGDLSFYTKGGIPFSASSLEERMTIKDNGNVGIGTSVPEASFHVKTAAASKNLIFESTSDNLEVQLKANAGNGFARLGLSSFGNFLMEAPFGNFQILANRVGINTGTSPAAILDVNGGGNWNLTDTEGDVRIGNLDYRLKIGVSTGGLGAGRVHIRAQGGINEISMGAGSTEILKIKEEAVVIDGEVNRPSTGDANMVPIAYGTISLSGSILNGSGNFRITKTGSTVGVYYISVNGESFDPAIHTVLLTKSQDLDAGLGMSDAFGFISYLQAGTSIKVYVSGKNGDLQDNPFSFIIYKP